MTKIQITPKIEADMFQVNVLCRNLKELLKVQPMALYDLLQLCSVKSDEVVTGNILKTIIRLQQQLDEMATVMEMKESEKLLTSEGRLTPFFRALLLMSITGKFPNYVIRPPLAHKGMG